jgi:CheY-like chemotaxis protein/HPt (histidine-containing phosphotransfer) domain-containing protein
LKRRNSADNTIEILFSVSDTGIGIDPIKKDKLFKNFSQIDASTTRKYGGTGLGLAICKQLAENMGGEIGVNSAPDKGSEFWFTVKLSKNSSSDRTDVDFGHILENKSVVIAVEHKTAKEVFQRELKAQRMLIKGIDLKEENLAETLKLLAESENLPDCLILDSGIDEVRTEQICHSILHEPLLKSIKIICMIPIGLKPFFKPKELKTRVCLLTKPVPPRLLSKKIAEFFSSDLNNGNIEGNLKDENEKDITPEDIHILLVEDNIINQKVALGILGKLGYKTDAVSDGQEALNRLSQMSYDLVLMDCQMPVMDGYEATKMIRSKKQPGAIRNIPVIAMTAHAMAGDREKCIQAGMNDYIAKPVSVDNLNTVINKWLGKSIKEKPKPVEKVNSFAIWDLDLLEKRLLFDDELIKIVIDTFVEDIPKQIEKLKHSIEEGNFKGIELIAHTIKGASANIAAEELRLLSEKMEECAVKKDNECLNKVFPKFSESFIRLKEMIEKEYGQKAA